MTRFPLLLVTASLASVASLAAAQTNALPGQDDMMQPRTQTMQGPQTTSPQAGQMNSPGPVANAPAPVQTTPDSTVQRYYRTAQVGPGTPDTTAAVPSAAPNRGTANSYGAPMYGSSQSGSPPATPLIGAPKN